MEKKRCTWIKNANPIMIEYHDNEWCVPKYDDKILFELLVLESFHTGLSWQIILNKRDNFRKAFDYFDTRMIAKYEDEKISQLLNDTGIVRNRSKINATIKNAKVFMEIQAEFGDFSTYIWGFVNNRVVKNTDGIMLTRSELSDTISKDMKKRGISYMGSITTYSYLQAIGAINDHQKICYKFEE